MLYKKLNYMSSSVTLADVRDLQYGNHIMNTGVLDCTNACPWRSKNLKISINLEKKWNRCCWII